LSTYAVEGIGVDDEPEVITPVGRAF